MLSGFVPKAWPGGKEAAKSQNLAVVPQGRYEIRDDNGLGRRGSVWLRQASSSTSLGYEREIAIK
jgi:hypothetical protein